jgi:hypothetical protein
VTSRAGSGSPAADGTAVRGSPWQPEPGGRAALRKHWGLDGDIGPMQDLRAADGAAVPLAG